MSAPTTASRTVLVTGASTGLGLETAVHLATLGFDVHATVRDMERAYALTQAARARSAVLTIHELDLRSEASIAAAVDAVIDRAGAIYGLVNNAGIGLRGCLEDLGPEEIREVFETNVFGTMAVTKRVLPCMRQARRGRIVTVTSVGGRIATFGLSAYCSSKFALEGFGEALALEIEPFGLKSVLVEPGIINTSRWNVNRGVARDGSNPRSPYYAMFRRSEAIADAIVARTKTQPVDVARTVQHALTAQNPRLRYIVGRPASAAVALKRFAPERLFERFYFGTLLRQIHPGAAQHG